MTDNIEPNPPAVDLESDAAEHRLPHKLELAMRRARARQPEPTQITRCIRSAKRLSAMAAPRRKAARYFGPLSLLGALSAAAAAIYLMMTWNLPPAPPELDRAPGVSLSLPVYSPVTRISLVAVGYQRIEADLDQADAEVAQAGEAIALSAVRLEVEQTLEEFYDWTAPGE